MPAEIDPILPEKPGAEADRYFASQEGLRIGILIVAYNAASTLARVLDRIPRDFLSRITEILVQDDASEDPTYLVGLGYKYLNHDLPLQIIKHQRNLGYGGNQKAGYEWAISSGLDVVVLLHGDGQYAPEHLPQMVEPFKDPGIDAVFGSRMLQKGAARKGGMPRYKYFGNRMLTKLENWALSSSLSEFHSGYRAYRVSSLAKIDFRSFSNGFDFDTQIIIEMIDKGMKIQEIPIPTFYGDEICYVNGLKYAAQVTKHALAYRFSSRKRLLARDEIPGGHTALQVETSPKGLP